MKSKLFLLASIGARALPALAQIQTSTTAPMPNLPAATRPTDPVVTVVKVKAPWYAPAFLLRRAFRKARPDYEKVAGLRFKYFTISASGPRYFGGIYLWASRAQAEAWFSPQWFERVRRTRHAEGEVRYFDLTAEPLPAIANYDFATAAGCQAVLVRGTAPAAVVGVLRRYELRAEGQPAAVLLFESAARAQAFLAAARPAAEVFDAPVLLRVGPL